VRKTLLAGVILALVVTSCGGSMSETEYVEGLNDLVESTVPRFEAVYTTYGQITEPTLGDLVARVEQELVIMYDVRDLFDALDPPGSIAEVNGIMVDTLGRLIGGAEALVDASGTVGSRVELEQTPEFASYESINAESDSMCPNVQAEFDKLADRPVIDDPWISDLRLSVRAFLDC
jgi:hypothetical protein